MRLTILCSHYQVRMKATRSAIGSSVRVFPNPGIEVPGKPSAMNLFLLSPIDLFHLTGDLSSVMPFSEHKFTPAPIPRIFLFIQYQVILDLDNSRGNAFTREGGPLSCVNTLPCG
jgi:hypothetical protein